jgi:hypothetical protein
LRQWRAPKYSEANPIPEWCGDWYNPYADGPAAFPLDYGNPEKRVQGWDYQSALPYHIGGAFGFRVVLA